MGRLRVNILNHSSLPGKAMLLEYLLLYDSAKSAAFGTAKFDLNAFEKIELVLKKSISIL